MSLSTTIETPNLTYEQPLGLYVISLYPTWPYTLLAI